MKITITKGKKTYHKPALKKYGSVKKITMQQKGGSIVDMNSEQF